MSQPPKNKVPPRRVTTTSSAERPAGNGTSANKAASGSTTKSTGTSTTKSASSASRSSSTRPAGNGSKPLGTRPSGSKPTGSRSTSRYAPPPRRDPFPYVMGAVIGALVVALMMVIFLISSNNNSGGVASNTNTGAVPTAFNNTGNAPDPNATNEGIATSAANSIEPIRMPIEEFMTLYNDPAKRPIIIDVRAKQAYDEGHIAGAISIPDPETESRLNEFPKDKLIIAYCQ